MSLEQQYQQSDNLEARIAIFQYAKSSGNLWQTVAKAYPWKAGGAVLEIGAGTGDFWLEAYKYIPDDSRVLLTDFSKGMLAKAKERLSNLPLHISYEVADANQLSYQPGSFESVISHFMLYHLNYPADSIHSVAQILKPGGWLGVVLPVRTERFASYLELAFEIRPELRDVFLATSVGNFFAQDFQVIAEEQFSRVDFHQLPGSEIEIPDIQVIVSAVKSYPAFQCPKLEDFFSEYRARLALVIKTEGAVRDKSHGPKIIIAHKGA